jgi:hypothetical protein
VPLSRTFVTYISDYIRRSLHVITSCNLEGPAGLIFFLNIVDIKISRLGEFKKEQELKTGPKTETCLGFLGHKTEGLGCCDRRVSGEKWVAKSGKLTELKYSSSRAQANLFGIL